MGNYLGLPTNDSNNNEEIEELKKRLSNLETIDKNGDGRISKEEIDIWMTDQKRDIVALERSIEDKYQKVIQENQEYKRQIAELECYVDTLKQTNKQLKVDIQNARKLELAGLPNTNNNNKLRLSEMSKARINEFVEELLNDENVNIKYFPDSIERKIYRNVFNILINLLDNVLDSTSVEFLGHKLTFDINPNDDDNDETL